MQRWSPWMHRVIGLGAPGVGAVILLRGTTLLVSLVMLALFVVTFAHLARSDDVAAVPRTRALCCSILRVSACVVTIVCCVSLTVSFHPAAGLLLVAGLAATSPPVRQRTARLAVPGSGAPGRGAAAARPELVGIRHFSDAELQHAWCHTSRVLVGATDPTRRLDLVITRQHLLDEVWKRDRAALEQWVADGARAYDGTSRYFDSP
jgi:hypothetical protein